MAQTDQNFELLIAGDGCTDNTAQVVRPYLSDRRLKWFDFPKGPGFGYAHRNTVFRKARGEYMAFMAHDDILFPDHLELLGRHLDTDQSIDIVYSRPLWVDRRGQIMPSAFNLNHPRMLRQFMDQGNAIPASCFVHRRNCFKRFGYWNDQLPEAADWDMYKRIARASRGKNVAFETVPTCLHFLASWRSSSQFDAWPHAVAIKFAKKHKLLPKSLKISPEKGLSEQLTIWQIIKDNQSWISDIRKTSEALADAINNYAPSEVFVLSSNLEATKNHIKGIEDQKTHLQDTNHKLQEIVQKQQTELTDLQNSLTLRLHNKLFSRLKPNNRLNRALRRIIPN